MSFNTEYTKIKALVENELSVIKNRVADSVSVHEPLNSYLKEVLCAPSKQIRSLVSLLYIKSLGREVSDEQFDLLSAVEIVHNASLIHDDIIDESDLRRGMETVSYKFGNKLGVISGDYLLARAMEKVVGLNSFEILKIFTNTLKQMCVGEINQHYDKFKIGTIENYLEKSKNKTAYLFQTALSGCAILNNQTDEALSNISEFALDFGIAFQIRDDLLNLVAKNDGKPLKNDIEDGIYNSAVIFARSSENYTSGIEKTRVLLNNYVESAVARLDLLAQNQYSQALRKLSELLNYD